MNKQTNTPFFYISTDNTWYILGLEILIFFLPIIYIVPYDASVSEAHVGLDMAEGNVHCTQCQTVQFSEHAGNY